jgi:hypothetical protein
LLLISISTGYAAPRSGKLLEDKVYSVFNAKSGSDRNTLSAGFRLAALLLVSASCFSPAQAAVAISFFSKEFGSSFPHAYIVLEGRLDRTGEEIAANYGFTATNVSPAVLISSVKGEVVSVDQPYMRSSDLHFFITLTDDEYDRVMETVQRWRALKQPSYNLDRRNCVFFVAQVAAALGMKADTPPGLMKKPRSYIQSLIGANSRWIESRGGSFARK